MDVLLADGQMGSAFPELRHSRSSDGGETWSDLVTIDTGGVLPSNPHRGMDASIGAVGDRLLAIWTGPGESKHGKGSMATSVSTDGGRTWRLGPRIGGKESLEGASYHDILTVGDTFHLAWTDGPSSAREFRYTQSMDGGTSWEPAKTLDATTCACCWNSLANFGSEKVYGLYRDGTPRDMYLAVSSDAGNTWDLRSRVGEFGWIFDGCPHVGGSVVVEQSNKRPVLHTVVWTGQEEKVGVYYLSSRDEGKTWTKPRPMGDDGAKHADIAVAKGGILAAAWDGYVNKQYAIFASISRDGGRTWSAPQRLSQEGVSATHPKVIATSQGFRVFWTDTNEDDYITWRSVRLGEDGRKLTEAAVPVYTRGPSVTSLYADHAGND
ncbi:MAG: exo-alpha-sialidase [Acidobacteria bacterium]|nr:exo-alpha-sialidase [Acidobacteriota bacterium]